MRSVYIALVVALASSPMVYGVADREIAGRQASEIWLTLVDEGKYSDALALAAEPLRDSSKEKEWVEGLSQVRKPLGSVKKRQLQRLFATTVLPGNIAGDFVIVNFQSDFENSEDSVTEIVIMSYNDSLTNKWQVISYFLE